MDTLVELNCDSIRKVPPPVILDIDDTLDRVHRHHDDHRCFLPIHIYDAGSG